MTLSSPRFVRLAAAALLATGLPAAQAAYVVTTFGPGAWGTSDTSLGLAAGARIEDFEDTTLMSGLTVQVNNSSSGSYGPGGTLPTVFDAVHSDPWGSAFVGGAWDGSHALLNTGNNQSANYGSTSAWGDVTFNFAGGASEVGFSLQQMQHDASVYINGSFVGTITQLSGIGLSGGRLGYLRFDATGGSAPITSLRIDGSIYDAWTIDHLAVTSAVPEPASTALMLAGLGLVGLRARARARRR